jgi:quercetin dioxygenase-like cupin family protein
MTEYRMDWEQLPWEHPAPGVRHKLYREGNRRLRLVEFSNGFVEPDWCTRGHIGTVVEGDLEVVFQSPPCTAGILPAQPRVRFSAGDGVFIPAGQQHGHKATVLSDVVRLVLVEEV